MIPWRLFPYLRPCLALIAGILARELIFTQVWPVVTSVCIALVLMILSDFVYKDSLRYPFISGYFIFILFFGLGFTSYHLQQSGMGNLHYGRFVKKGEEARFIGVVLEYPDARKKFRTKVEMEFLCYDNQCYKTRNPVQLSFDSAALKDIALSPGDRIVSVGVVKPIRKNTNPATFDFAHYLKRQNITHQVFVTDDVMVIAKNQLGFFRQTALNFRNYCLRIFEKYLEGEPLAIAKAMILGFRQDVNDDLYKSFSASGSMHILAVSGMHLAVIAEILLRITDRMTQRRKGASKLASFLIIVFLWFFSFMTGAESAIIRSVLMFTLILYGKTLQHHHSTFNIMAFCATIMLIYQPSDLFNAGFLFSFLALLSLMYFQPVIQAWWQPADKFSNWVWQYISASIAAQILVGPLTIFLFHQFPVYFILSGFVPVWLSAIALKMGLLLLLLENFLSQANVLVSIGLDFTLSYFIRSVRWVESLPCSSVGGLYLSTVEFVFYTFALFFLMLAVKFRTLRTILALGICIGMAVLWNIGNKWYHNDQILITVYDHQKVNLFDVFVGPRCYAFGDSTQTSIYADYLYSGHRAMNHIQEVRYIKQNLHSFLVNDVIVSASCIKVGDSAIAVIASYADFDKPFRPSFYLISKSLWPPKQSLHCGIPFVLCASIKGKMLERWKQYALENDVILYSVFEQGALVLKPPFKIENP